MQKVVPPSCEPGNGPVEGCSSASIAPLFLLDALWHLKVLKLSQSGLSTTFLAHQYSLSMVVDLVILGVKILSAS